MSSDGVKGNRMPTASKCCYAHETCGEKKSGLVSMAVVSLGAACKLEADDASDW